MRTPAGGLPRQAAVLGYLAVARHLPWSPRPGGNLARALRARLAGRMLDECGEHVNVEHGAWFGSGAGISLGDRSDIGMDALVIGPARIGADVMMGPRCILLGASHTISETTRPMNQQGFGPEREIVIEDDVFIGAGTIILPGRRIGRGSVIGAGSVVAHDVPAWSVVAGNPAQVVRWRKEAQHRQAADTETQVDHS